jgi:Domain of unknown function (DUF4262)
MPRGFDDYIRKARRIIRDHGWMVQAVLPDERQTSFSYSVGLSSKFSHPEVFMVGFDPELARSLINAAGNHIKGGIRFDAPMLADGIIEGFPAAFRPLRQSSVIDHSNAGRTILGKSFPGVQLFLPDAGGRFPWEPGCDPRYAEVQTSLLETEGEPPAWS